MKFVLLACFWLAKGCLGYVIQHGGCVSTVELNEDIRAELTCGGTGNTVTWSMFFQNGTSWAWRDLASCDAASCTSRDPRYQATRPSSSTSKLEILNTDRDTVGTSVRCGDEAGDKPSVACKLRLKCTPTKEPYPHVSGCGQRRSSTVTVVNPSSAATIVSCSVTEDSNGYTMPIHNPSDQLQTRCG